MSNRKKATNPTPENWLNQAIAPIDGARIPGGCDTCNAYQMPKIIDRGVTRITVHHDDWCPTLRAMQATR